MHISVCLLNQCIIYEYRPAEINLKFGGVSGSLKNEKYFNLLVLMTKERQFDVLLKDVFRKNENYNITEAD